MHIQSLILLFLLAAFWSPNFLFIKIAVEGLSPFTITFFRIVLGGSLLFGMMKWKGYTFPREPKFWFHTLGVAFFSSILPSTLFAFAEASIESAMAAVINGSAPMFTALLAHMFIPTDKLHLQKILGIFLSLVGLLILVLPSMQEGVSGHEVGILIAILGSLSFGTSHVYAKMTMMGHKPFVAPTAQLIVSFVVLLPVVLFQGGFSEIATMPSYHPLIGVAGLGILGTFCALTVYFKLVEICNPTAISMVACCFPVGGMILGYVFLGETMSWTGLAAAGLILLGIVTVNEVFKPRLPVKTT